MLLLLSAKYFFFKVYIVNSIFFSDINALSSYKALPIIFLSCKSFSKLKHNVNSLTTKKQTTKFLSANFQKMISLSYIKLRIQRLEGNQCRSR